MTRCCCDTDRGVFRLLVLLAVFKGDALGANAALAQQFDHLLAASTPVGGLDQAWRLLDEYKRLYHRYFAPHGSPMCIAQYQTIPHHMKLLYGDPSNGAEPSKRKFPTRMHTYVSTSLCGLQSRVAAARISCFFLLGRGVVGL